MHYFVVFVTSNNSDPMNLLEHYFVILVAKQKIQEPPNSSFHYFVIHVAKQRFQNPKNKRRTEAQRAHLNQPRTAASRWK